VALVDAPRHGRPYRTLVANLKARGPVQVCGRQESPRCPRILYADRPKGHAESITLGHIVAWIDTEGLPDAERVRIFRDPANHRPECPACNYGDESTRRGWAARRTTPKPRVKSYRNPRW
jgi:hypothetical protein